MGTQLSSTETGQLPVENFKSAYMLLLLCEALCRSFFNPLFSRTHPKKEPTGVLATAAM